MGRYHYVFPKWTNFILPAALIAAAITPLYVVYVVAYGFSPQTTDVGYQPVQPIPFSHKLHAGELGLDCRYCHNTVEYAHKAAIPPTQTCMNCHSFIHPASVKIAPLNESHQTGNSVPWLRVHDLPDYSYFSHAAHINRGVSCVECHGRVDRMEVVRQFSTLSMGWCLECHRDPVSHLRPIDKITDLAFDQTTALTADERLLLKDLNRINPSQDCSTCHR